MTGYPLCDEAIGIASLANFLDLLTKVLLCDFTGKLCVAIHDAIELVNIALAIGHYDWSGTHPDDMAYRH